MPRPVRQSASTPPKSTVPCPVCGKECNIQSINAHIDKCLTKDDPSPARKKARREDDEDEFEEPKPAEPKPKKSKAKLNPQWAAVLTSPTSKKQTSTQEKPVKQSAKSKSDGGSTTPEKKAACEDKRTAVKQKRAAPASNNDKDVFDFDTDDEKDQRSDGSGSSTPQKVATPSKEQPVTNKPATPTHKKSPTVGTNLSSVQKSPGAGASPGVSTTNQTPPSPWVRPNVQTGKPTLQAGKQRPDFRPLAERMRPQNLEAFVGQHRLLGANSMLRRLLDAGNIPSMVFWGPPGCGKTTLAHVIARQAKAKGSHRFITLSATTSNVAEVKSAIEMARNEQRMFRRKTILFIDEIHRFNKVQQDTFLQHVENGTITLIGATTENPSFRVNSALLSRCRVVVFEKLAVDNIITILQRALKEFQVNIVDDPRGMPGMSNQGGPVTIERNAVLFLANMCDGDARTALNNLQTAIDTATGACPQGSPKPQRSSVITMELVKESLQRSHVSYDRVGEEHYNCVSALQKSIRGSDANAALYWLGRMLVGGEDPLFIARRLVVCASEDIGLADPHALVQAIAAHQASQYIGMPECEINLAHCVVYLSRAPKSWEVYTAYSRVKECIKNHQGPMPAVPLHLRTPATQYHMRNAMGGYGKGYMHEGGGNPYRGFLPECLMGADFFRIPT